MYKKKKKELKADFWSNDTHLIVRPTLGAKII